MKEIDRLKTFFDNSLFHDILFYTNGAHIAPHNDERPYYMGYYHSSGTFDSSDVKFIEENKLLVEGTFEVIDERGIRNECIVTDSGDFKSTLTFTNDVVSMTTITNVSRKVQGIDKDGQSDRDAFFTCLNGGGSSGTIVCTEHFIKIANGTRLLHYSNDYDAFEIFDLPDNWSIVNGITDEMGMGVKVFDDTTFDLNDKDLATVFDILDSREKKSELKKLLKSNI